MTDRSHLNRSADPPSDAAGFSAGTPADAGAPAPAQGVSEDDAEALARAAEQLAGLAEEVSSGTGRAPAMISGSDQPVVGTPKQFEMPAFEPVKSPLAAKAIDLLSNVNLNVKIELGRTRMLVSDVLKLSEGAVVELDKLAGDPVDIYVNDRPIARGEVLVLNENFCVRINEILPQQQADLGKAAG